MKRTILGIFFILFCFISNAQSDLSIKNYGPSRGRIPRSYATQIDDNIGNLNTAKFYANKAISYFLDDDCPLPKNLAGDFKDEKGNDAASMFRANEGCNTLMLSLFRLYLAYPNDAECKGYLDRVIRFSDCILQYGTDRYGNVHSPLLASILMRGSEPFVPVDPENPSQGVRIETRDVWSYSDNKIINNYCAIGVGNIWYDSDESHKASWRGSDVEVNTDLYSLFYQMSWALDAKTYPDRAKYKKAADASLSFWINNCQTESNLYPWGEHSGWDFYKERYNNDYYHAPFHEYKGNFRTNLDKLIENQARVRPDEMTHFEKYATGIRAAHTADADKGARYNGYLLEGIFLFCRHGTLWTDRITARNQEEYSHNVNESFGCFPKHIGSYLYIMSLAYNRSHNQKARDSIAINMNYFLDGIETQRTVYTGGAYYPYGTFSWKGYPTQLKNDQNYDLGTFAKRASYLMDGLDNSIKGKLLTVAQNTGVSTIYGENLYPGPAIASTTFPQDEYVVYKNESVQLEWRASDKASTYRIYLSENERKVALATPDSAAFVQELSDTKCVFSGLTPNNVYYWAVDALNANGDITKGNVMKFSTSDADPTPIQTINLNHSSSELDVYQNQTLIPSYLPENASNKFVVWTSSDTSKAVVDDNGKVTARLPGIVNIRATSVDGTAYGNCELTINQLSQSISFEPISTKYLPADRMLKMGATATSSLPVSYDVVSGPAVFQQQTNVYPVESAYINGSTMTSQDLLRLKVNGMNALFKINLSGINVENINSAVFEYTTVVDGHRRNYDVDVNMLEYQNGWNSGGSVPALVSASSISNTILQSKIAPESSFQNSAEYIKAYQTPLALDITDFIKNKIATNQQEFCIALKSIKKSASDGEDYVRIGSSSNPDASLRARLVLYGSGNGDVLKLNGAGFVTIRISQSGDAIYHSATDVTSTFEVIDNSSSINQNNIDELIKIYPNPLTSGDLNISLNGLDPTRIVIYNSMAQQVFAKVTDTNESLTLPRSLFNQGLYVVSVVTPSGVFNYKLIVD